MESSSVVERLTAAWCAAWPDTPPKASLLRGIHPDRWVRFHSLPASKRYADSEAEYATILERYNRLLDALGSASELFLVGPDIGTPSASLWQTLPPDDYDEFPLSLYVRCIDYPSAELDDILRTVADDEIAEVIIGPPDLRWLYHPYDGGADVIAPSASVRDQLRAQFADWLSSHRAGL